MLLIVFLLNIFVAVKSANGARILGVYPLPWGSHYILGIKLMKGLAEAGHDVTLISPYPTKNPPARWTDVVLDGLDTHFEALIANTNMIKSPNEKFDMTQQMKDIFNLMATISNATLHHPRIQKLADSGIKFEAVIIDQFMNDCHLVFGYLFGGHLILASTVGPNILINSKVGNPSTMSSNPVERISNKWEDVGFIDRCKSFLFSFMTYMSMAYYRMPLHDQIMHEAFPNAPSLESLSYNVSLVLLNSHTSLIEAVPTVPNMVEIGGFHIDPPKKLPEDLEEFLNNAEDGAVYFSLGSMVKSKDLPEETRKIFLNVFKSLNKKVLWKFEDELPEKPDNVLIKRWLPQQDVLAHSNIKLFITHGGLLSITESVHHGIPLLTIPLFGDQEMNAENVVKGGFGLKLHLFDENFSEEYLRNHLSELLNNSTYTENIKKRSRIYHDRPMKPLQTAIYWIEHVIKHNGASHLRVAHIGMPWHKYYMVDVIAFFIVIGFIILISVAYLIKVIVSAIRHRRTTNKMKVS